MPAADRYTPDQAALRAAADEELRDKNRRFRRHHDYYAGYHRRPLTPRDGHDDNIIFNLCRAAIDRTITFLFPTMPGFVLPQDMPEEAGGWLHQVWEENGGAALLAALALNGALNGHVFARVSEGDPRPRVVALSPAQTLIFWQSDDYAQVLWYEIHWQRGRTPCRQDIVNDGAVWQIIDYAAPGGRWEQSGAPVIWNSPFAPLISWQHLPRPLEVYGDHELGHAGLNDAVNKIAGDINRILRFHAYPRTIGTGFEAGTVQSTAIDDFWTIASPDAHVFNLEMQSDLTSSLRFLDLLMQTFWLQSRVTVLSQAPENLQNVTNLGLRAAFMDMLAKNEVLRRAYGWGIQEISRRLLLLGGFAPVAPQILWREALPADRREEIAIAQAEMELELLDKKQALARLGLGNPEG